MSARGFASKHNLLPRGYVFKALAPGLTDTIGISIKRYSTDALLSGTVRYVDASRPDDSGNGLSLQTAKKTVSAGIAASAAGDTLKISNGTYNEAISVSKTITMIGESRDGVKFIARADNRTFFLSTAAQNCRISGFTVIGTGDATREVFGITLTSSGNIIEDFVIENTVLSGIANHDSTGANILRRAIIKGGRRLSMSAGSLTLDFISMLEAGIAGIPAISMNGGTLKINNSILAGGPTTTLLRAASGATIINNSIIFGAGEAVGEIYTLWQSGSATVTVNNSLLNGAGNSPWYYRTLGTITFNNCQENKAPRFVNYGKNTGILSIHAIDSAVIDNSMEIIQEACQRAEVHATVFIDDQDHLTANQITKAQAFVAAGNDLGCEGNSSSRLDDNPPFTITYTGTESNCTLNISNGQLSITTTEGGDNQGPIAIGRGSANQLVGVLVQTINNWPNINASMNTIEGDYDDAYADCLLDGVFPFVAGEVDVVWDMDKYLTEEVIVAKSTIESVIGGGNQCKSYFYPRYVYYAQAEEYIKSAGYKIALQGKGSPCDLNGTGSIYALTAEYNLNLNKFKGANYAGLTEEQKEARIRGGAAALATVLLRYGLWQSLLLGSQAPAQTADELFWLLDEMKKSGVLVLSFAEVADYLDTNATRTGDSYSINTSQSYDLELSSDSLCIGVGTKTTLSGTVDLHDAAGIKIYDGTTQLPDGPWLDGVDIGPYAYVVGGKYFLSLLGPDGAKYWPSAPELIARTGVDNAIYNADGTGKTFATPELALAAMETVSDDQYLFVGGKGAVLYSTDMSAQLARIQRAGF